MSKTKIEWTDETWNVSTGCSKVSAGCKNCYAERLFPRVYGNDTWPIDVTATRAEKRKFTDIKLHHDRLEKPLHWKKPRMIFVNSMSDLFHEEVPDDFIYDCFQVMGMANQHIFQVLTKRPERMLDVLNNILWLRKKPLNNVWLGVSVEDQKTAEERIPILMNIPAKVRWLSIEPILERVNLCYDIGQGIGDLAIDNIDWIVVGAESGSNRRECKIEWIEDIVDQCKAVGVPVFVKQVHIDGKLVKHINLFPENLRVREYPELTKGN